MSDSLQPLIGNSAAAYRQDLMGSEWDSDQLPVMQLLQALLRGNGGMDRVALSVQEPDDSAERLRTLQLQALLTTLQVRRFLFSLCAVVSYHGSRPSALPSPSPFHWWQVWCLPFCVWTLL